MRTYHLNWPPRSLRRSTVHLDNVALIPASLLPFKAEWQAIANDLADGEILIVLNQSAPRCQTVNTRQEHSTSAKIASSRQWSSSAV